MKISPRSFSSFVLGLAALVASLLCTPAFASDAKKPAAPVVEEKKFNYVEEEGTPGRSGYVYKRVAREKLEEPKQLPKEEPKPAPKAEAKDSHGKPDAHGKPDKNKKEEPALSTVYDPAVIKLDINNRPLTKSVQTNAYADYFLCRKTISEKYKNTVLNEINTFADRMGLPRAQDTPCMIKVAKPKTKFPGAIYIEFYVDEKAAKECIRVGECGATRVAMLFPKDKTGIKSKDVYRSYVLTDEHKYVRSSFCVSPDGKLLGEKNCYVALHPDWLFN